MASNSLPESALPEVYTLEQLGINSDSLFTEMESLVVSVELKTDPDSYYIGEKLAAIRDASRRAQTLFIRIQKASSTADNKLVELESNYDILLNSSLENDSDVQAGQSSVERTAIAGNKLVAYKRLIKTAKSVVRTLSSLEKALNLCLRNLKSTNDDIKSQSKLMEALLHNLKTSDMGKVRENPLLKETMNDLDQFDKLADEMLEQQGTEDTAEVELPEMEETSVEVAEIEEDADPADPVIETPEQYTLPVEELMALSEDEYEIDPGLTGAPASVSISVEPSIDTELILGTVSYALGTPPVPVDPPEEGELSVIEDDDDIMGMLMDGEDVSADTDVVPTDLGMDDLDALVGSSMETAAKAPKPFATQAVPQQEPPAVEAPQKPKASEEEPASVDDLLTQLGLL